MTFEEDDIIALERSGKASKPAIASLPEWNEILPYIVRSETAGASRSHVYLRPDTPEPLIKRLLKIHVPCANSNCPTPFAVIRKHLNARLWSIHVSGPGAVHKRCHKCQETKDKTLWLYVVAGQAGASPRVKKAYEDSRQRLMDLECD